MAEVNVHQWKFLGSGRQVMPRRAVTLRNIPNDQSIRYGEREYGINLVWDGAADLGNMTIERSRGTNAIRFGDAIAIRIQNGGYLRYEEREYGVNLVWSSQALYEWEVTGGIIGQAVALNRQVGLFNRTHGDHLVYGEREYGINLRWWSDLEIFKDYPPLPIPQTLRSRSGEPGQIEVSGTASEIEVFHGGTDDELDWHIYIRLDAGQRRTLFRHLIEHGKNAKVAHQVTPNANVFTPLTEEDLERVFCEWMVLDGWDNSAFDEKFFSADLTRTLALQKKAWDISAKAAQEQGVTGATVSATRDSLLCASNAYVQLQGAFVNDRDHRFRVEIHPLDSLAYALDAQGGPVSATPDDPTEWPTNVLTWRVAAFTNSSFHRINGADYIKKERTSTWYLPLPSSAHLPGYNTTVTESFPAFTNEARGRAGMDDLRQTPDDEYRDYGVRQHSAAIEADPRDGVRKLRVTVTMRPASDRWGGMFLGEYRLRARPPVIATTAEQ
jgi:hypothetical protein